MADNKTVYTEVLTDNGVAHNLLIDGTPAFTHVVVQIVGSGGGDSFDLQGSLEGTNFHSVGTLVNDTPGTLATNGFLFYLKDVPMKLRLTYTATNVVPDVTMTVRLVKPARGLPINY